MNIAIKNQTQVEDLEEYFIHIKTIINDMTKNKSQFDLALIDHQEYTLLIFVIYKFHYNH